MLSGDQKLLELCDICRQRHKDGDCPVTTTVTGLRVDHCQGPEKIYMRVPPPAETDEMAYLNEPATGRKFAIPYPICKVGRSPSNHVVISGDTSVSSVHFIISFEGGRFYLSDVGTTNGTFLNGEKLKEKVALYQDDRIRAGRFCLSFSFAKRVKEGRFPTGGILQQSNSLPESLADHVVPVPITVEMTKTKAQERALKAALAGTEFGEDDGQPGGINFVTPGEAIAAARQSKESGDLAQRVSPSGLCDLERELDVLRKQSEAVQERIREYELRLATVGNVGGTPDELAVGRPTQPQENVASGSIGSSGSTNGREPFDACLEAFVALGWKAERLHGSDQELALFGALEAEALVRIVIGEHYNAFMELGKLLTSDVDEGSVDSKTVKRFLVVPVNDSQAQPIETELAVFSAKTKVCLVSTAMLTGWQKRIADDPAASERIRNALLISDGIPQLDS